MDHPRGPTADCRSTSTLDSGRPVYDLGDDALQTYFVIGLIVARTLVDIPPSELLRPEVAALIEVRNVASAAAERLRTALMGVEQTQVYKPGLAEALGRVVHAFEQRTGLRVEMGVSGLDLPPRHVHADVAERLFGVAAEALGYIERGGTASSISVLLRIGRRSVTLDVQDDAGFFTRTRLPLARARR
jgi:signal transduction histidine kinase